MKCHETCHVTAQIHPNTRKRLESGCRILTTGKWKPATADPFAATGRRLNVVVKLSLSNATIRPPKKRVEDISTMTQYEWNLQDWMTEAFRMIDPFESFDIMKSNEIIWNLSKSSACGTSASGSCETRAYFNQTVLAGETDLQKEMHIDT